MIRQPLKAPCGNTFTIVARDEAEIAARKAQLEIDHAEGRGCHLCVPASYPPQPPKGYGSSLLDGASTKPK